MALADQVVFAAGGQLLRGILAHQFMQVEAMLPSGVHQGLVYQTKQERQRGASHWRSFLKLPAAPKDAQAHQDALFHGRKQAP